MGIEKDSKYRSLFVITLVVLVVAFSLYPSLLNSWVNWDDPVYVVENPLIQSLNWDSISTIFSTPQVVGLYHPLTLISLAIDYQFWETDPYGFHLTNLVIHLINTVLVFFLFRRVKSSILVAGFVALLFGMHPMHVESVAWISARKDVLYTLFFLISVLSYLRSAVLPGARRAIWLTVSLIAFCLSLLSKNIAFTLPFVLVLFDYLQARKLTAKLFLDKIPFVALAVIAMIVAKSGQIDSDSMGTINSVDYSHTIFYGMYNSIFYIFKALAPVNLAAFHPFPMEGESFTLIYLAVIPFLVLVFLIYLAHKRSRKVFFGLVFFIISIAPLLQIIPFGKALSSERYTYVAYLGLFYILAIFIEKRLHSDQKWIKQLTLLLASIWLVLLVVQTRKQSTAWENSETLWTQVIDQYPTSQWAYMSRGLHYAEEGQNAQAMDDLNRSIEIQPFSQALYERAILLERGDREGAVRDYLQSIKLDSTYAQSHMNLGVIYAQNQEIDKAIQSFESAIRHDQEYSFAYFNCATAFKIKGDTSKAMEFYSRAIDLEPSNVRYLTFRGVFLLDLAKPNEAINDFSKAIEHDSKVRDPYYLRSVAYYQLGQYDRAMKDVERAVQNGYPPPEEYIQELSATLAK